MLVQNKRKSIIFCPTPSAAMTDERFVKEINGAKGLKLLPGVNDVNVALFEACAEHPLIKHMIDEGEIVVVDEKKKSSNITKLSSLPEKAARQLVRETIDDALLKRWANEETREPIKKAVLEQLEKISPTKGGDKNPDGSDKNPKQ